MPVSERARDDCNIDCEQKGKLRRAKVRGERRQRRSTSKGRVVLPSRERKGDGGKKRREGKVKGGRARRDAGEGRSKYSKGRKERRLGWLG